MPAPATARALAREHLTRAITDEARRQLISTGADQLSLRAIARELGMASSALYRYFASRDELLTALIVQAYSDLGQAMEDALTDSTADAPAEPRARFTRTAQAARGWALAHRHEYALIYGSPVPGYRAPQETTGPAARVPLALLAPVVQAHRAGQLQVTPGVEPAPLLHEQLAGVGAQLDIGDLPESVVLTTIAVWTALFGAISFELFGHLVGSVDPSDQFFAHVTADAADRLGLPR